MGKEEEKLGQNSPLLGRRPLLGDTPLSQREGGGDRPQVPDPQKSAPDFGRARSLLHF